MNYVIQTIDEEKEKKFMYRIAEFYCDFLVIQYKVNSAVEQSDDMLTEEEKELVASLTIA